MKLKNYPVPGQLGAFLNSGPLRAELVVTRADGGALSAADLALTAESLSTWETVEARRSRAPEPASIVAAVEAATKAAAERERKATTKPAKGARKPTPSRTKATKAPAKHTKRAAAKRR